MLTNAWTVIISPRPSTRFRGGLKKSDALGCKGDEICRAKQGLVLAVVASGPLREGGYMLV